ncbi:MAG: DUF4350 domain-containing protein [Haloferacaceae archaeon]
MNRRDWGKRVAVLVIAAAAVVAVSAGAAVVAPGQAPADEPQDLPEYQPDRITSDPIAAEGTVQPDRSAVQGSGTVVIDAGHGNRFSRSDVQPLVEGLTKVGYDVEFYTSGDLGAQLEDAKAFVVIDPGKEYRSGDVEDVRKFTGQGGHLLVMGEPTRIQVSGGLFGVSLVEQQSAVTTLTSSYGMSVDTAYLYNQRTADTNYKFITTEPGSNADLGDVERTTMYTAAAVRAQGGTVLLRSSANTLTSSTDEETGQHPVAVRRNEVVLVGDKSFLGSGRYKVADNEAFVAYLVEFLGSSDREPGTEISGDGGGSGGSSASPQPNDSGSPTAE